MTYMRWQLFGVFLLPAVLFVGCAQTAGDVRSNGDLNGSAERVALPTAGLVSQNVEKASELSQAHRVFFSLGSALVDASGLLKLRQMSTMLIDDENRRVTLVGHTDNLGSRSFNLAVAEKRVNEVARLLRSFGVSPSQIRRYPVGNEKMPAECHAESCRKQMRRVDLILSE